MRVIHNVLLITGGLVLLAAPFFAKRIPATQEVSNFSVQGPSDGRSSYTVSNFAAPDVGAHEDHNPKHGGTFFMSMDNKHHLEGVLIAPGIFRVYLYDDHTKPLKEAETRKASGTIQVGDSDTAPKIELAPGKQKEALEANLGNGVKFPVTITLHLHLPGTAPDARPELFNFKFTKFTADSALGSCGPIAAMPKMHC